MSLDDLEISVNYLDQAVKLLDELFGKNNYEDRLGYIFDRFVSVNECYVELLEKMIYWL